MNAIQQLLTEHMAIWTAAETEKKSGRGNTSINSSGVYGIKKLRELILELAINGKIVHSEDIYKHTKLGDIGTWAVGSGFPTVAQGSQAGNILFAKVSDMNNPGNEKFILQTNNTITEEVAKELRVNIHPRGTVIFPKIGGAIATNKRRILVKPTAIDNNCLGLIPKNGVSSEWIFLILSAIDLSKYQAGTSVPALAQGVLQEIQVMLPNLQEQHRIVAKVDELMALCDQLEAQHSNAVEAHEKLISHLLGTLTQSQSADDFSANWQRIAAHFDMLFTTEASIDALKQTLLQLAVMGKLVPQDPNDEPASELLKRIQAEKAKLIAEGKLKKEKPLAPITEDEKPFELTNGWEWVRFSDVYFFQEGPGIRNWQFRTKGIKLLNVQNIVGSTLVLDNTDKFIDEDEYAQKYKHFTIEEGDLLFASSGGSWGKSAFFHDVDYKVIVNTSTIRIKPYLLNLSTSYLKYFLDTKIFKKQLEVQLVGMQPNFGSTHFLKVISPLPPLNEQHRIVAKVDELMALCDQLKTRIQQANQQQQVIADVLVAQALD